MKKTTYKKSYDKEELKKLVESGKTRNEIAKALGISKSAVDVGLKQYGLVGINSRKKYEKEQIEEYLKAGKTSEEIAELMGVARVTVDRWIRDNGLGNIKKENRQSTKTEKAMILARQGYTAQEISEKTGISISIAYIAITKLKEQHGINADRHLCKTCKYRGKVSGCDYYCRTDKVRGCEVEECNKYIEGERLKGKDE